MFITFEGIDYSGKSTQIERFAERLKHNGFVFGLYRDPGGTSISERIRSLLLDRNHQEMSAWTELLLYEAARAQMVEEQIRPALGAGNIVVCDRFFDSTTAYQGYGRGLDLERVQRANEIGSCGLLPEITFYIDMEPAEALLRRAHRPGTVDRLESEGLSLQQRVRKGYLHILAQNAKRIIRINGGDDIDAIHEMIWTAFQNRWAVRQKR